MKFTRTFAIPNADTFSIKPIEEFVKRYLLTSKFSVDPFARNKRWCSITNDLNPATSAQFHLDAEEFLLQLPPRFDLGIFDPPYSPRQISECYAEFGREATREDTQNGRLYKRVRDALDRVIIPGGTVLSFGWNSSGMGLKRSYAIEELMLVAHGGAHNDTICLAERKL
jgi:hypothetical protein